LAHILCVIACGGLDLRCTSHRDHRRLVSIRRLNRRVVGRQIGTETLTEIKI